MMFNKEVYSSRRLQLMKDVGSGMILLLGNRESSMSYADNWYPFRQDSSFLYFFGIDKPNLVGVLNADTGEQCLYGDEATIEDIVWMGRTRSLKELADKVGISIVNPSAQLAADIPAFSGAKSAVHYLPPYRPEHVLQLSNLLKLPVDSLNENKSVVLIKAIVKQRSYKENFEIVEMEKAVNATNTMQLEAIRHAREGMTEAAVAARLQAVAIASGGNLSFPSILTVNGQTLHNHYSQQQLQNGQLVLCDCGAESGMHYAGDLTRTFPVSNQFTSEQRTIYDIVLNSYEAAVAALRPGVFFRDVHMLACEKLTEGLQQIGLMKGDVKESVAAGAHALFFPCGLGHMIGLDTHDMENLGEEYVGYTDDLKKSTQFGLKSLRLGRQLETGFTITVEPGLYFIPELTEQWAAMKKFTSFICYDKLDAYSNFGGIRIEDDYLVTETGSRKLGDPFSYNPDEIESWRSGT